MRDYGNRVLGIARRSNRNEEATTIPKIHEALTTACDREGFELVYTAEDGGVSGKYSPFDVTKRKDLAPWLTDPALIDQWDVLMFTESDRVVRKARFSDELFEWCEAHGKTVMRTDGHTIDYNDDGEWLSVSINAIIDEQYRRGISRKRKASATHLARQGKLGYGDWGLGYGFGRGADATPAVIAAEAEVLRDIASMVINGNTLTAVCDTLTAGGVKTRRGGVWAPSAVSRMLARLSEPYARAADGSPYYLPEIIAPDELARVQAKLAERSFRMKPKASTDRHDSTLLLQVAFCAGGHPLYSLNNSGNHGRTMYAYYYDRSCKGRTVRMDKLDALAGDFVTMVIGSFPYMEPVFIPASGHGKERAQIGRQMEDIEAQVLDGFPAASAKRVLAKLQARLDELPETETQARTGLRSTGKTVAQEWETGDRAKHRKMLTTDLAVKMTVWHEDSKLRVQFESPAIPLGWLYEEGQTIEQMMAGAVPFA